MSIRFYFQELSPGAFQDDPAGLQDVAVARDLQGGGGVLLHQKDGNPLLVEPADDVEDLPDQQRRQAQGGLIQEQQPGPGHQGPAQSQHLLLAAAQGAGRLALAFRQARKGLINLIQVPAPGLLGGKIMAAVASQEEILTN